MIFTFWLLQHALVLVGVVMLELELVERSVPALVSHQDICIQYRLLLFSSVELFDQNENQDILQYNLVLMPLIQQNRFFQSQYCFSVEAIHEVVLRESLV